MKAPSLLKNPWLFYSLDLLWFGTVRGLQFGVMCKELVQIPDLSRASHFIVFRSHWFYVALRHSSGSILYAGTLDQSLQNLD